MQLIQSLLLCTLFSLNYASGNTGDDNKADTISTNSEKTSPAVNSNTSAYATTDKIKVYPNPASDYFAIDSYTMRIEQVLLKDAMGNVLFTDTNPFKGNTIFMIDGYAAGNYEIVLKTEGKEYVKRIKINR